MPFIFNASTKYRPIYKNIDIEGSTYKAVYVDDMGYIPN